MRPGDRLLAVVTAVVAGAVGVVGYGYRVPFVTDALGPKGLPWVAALLLGAGAVGIWARPGPGWRMAEGASIPRAIGLTAAFLAYAGLLPYAGFLVATTLVVSGISWLFGAGRIAGVVFGMVCAGVLWVVFAIGLGIPLPIGSLFRFG